MFSKCSVVRASSTSMASSKMTRGSRMKRWAMCRAKAGSMPPSRRARYIVGVCIFYFREGKGLI